MEDAGTLSSVRDVLLRQPDTEFACIFGSFAKGRQTPASDIDVAVRRARAHRSAAPTGAGRAKRGFGHRIAQAIERYACHRT